MSEYGEYKLKSTIIASAETKAKYLLDTIVKRNILEFYMRDGSTITGTTNFNVAGDQPGFNSEEMFHLYDLDKNEWTTLKYNDVDSMEYISGIEQSHKRND